ncbi:polyphosphate polymerase domain-containing protein [Prevotella sp. E2-28]|uniref:polyphosphate polymerase domain-containing protein n=1 Tax=Prevotella sp. E2-28 TaxID=2913620 RepID=UPI001EDA8DC3|nr:polyphosphate polymerase domain-containing protein [Prevotella sp. E2-28]UKK54733.1 polyphosphate polymerase domain-containing protein [Prevotella sp. E2-28]
MEDLLFSFAPITLDEMSSVKLMNRTDTKFVTSMPKLLRLLKMAQNDYYAQEINGERNMLYDTTYFDTRMYEMYNEHQHGHANRQKIRFRTYVSSNLQFMEVKTKNNHGRTKKKRIEVADMNLADQQKKEFLAKTLRYDADTLIPHMHNYFHRITLVNKAKTERLTIDTALQFHNVQTGVDRDMGPLVIIELKRDGLVFSPVLEMLRKLHIHPHGFSKYCMGAALTNETLPVNRFRQKLRDVERILKNSK